MEVDPPSPIHGPDAVAEAKDHVPPRSERQHQQQPPPQAKPVVIVEVCRRSSCVMPTDALKLAAYHYLEQNIAVFITGLVEVSESSKLHREVEFLRVTVEDHSDGVPFRQASIRVFVFGLSEEVGAEELESGDGDDEGTVAMHQWELPHRHFEGLWESLYFPPELKQHLMAYAATAMLFSSRQVDPNLIACNRLILLHGPPGTGKTSLCKALAQKLAVHLSGRYPCTQLLEINSHSLFSKWFSESGKLVMRLFERINELAQDPDMFLCVLVDEVESLSAARQAALGGSEPSDAIRSVNALLTQIDKLKRYPNVLVLTTSNITEAIDDAFLDRTDLKFFVGLPEPQARMQILDSCLQELRRVGLVQPISDRGAQVEEDHMQIQEEANSTSPEAGGDADCDLEADPSSATPGAEAVGGYASDSEESEGDSGVADVRRRAGRRRRRPLTLAKVARVCEGMSGRALRKLPFQAFARDFAAQGVSEPRFLRMLLEAAWAERCAKQRLSGTDR